MTIKELQMQYSLHNVAPPHSRETCDICKRFDERYNDPLRDLNGNNF